MPLNNNNFLRWDGVIRAAAFTLNSDPIFPVTLFANEESGVCSPLVDITASNGIDYTSFNIVSITNSAGGAAIELVSPPSWDSEANELTFYRPQSSTIGAYKINFYFSDLLGNRSALCILVVNVSPIYTTWVAYPVSQVCVLDNFGNNTGYKSYGSLQLVNMSTGAPIAPLTLKDNIQGDPDYVAPVQDYLTCPPPGAGSGNYSALIVANNSQNALDPNNYITITSIYLSSSNMGPGGTPFRQNIPCNIPPGKSVRFMVPTSSTGYTYDGGLTIQYLVTGNMITASIIRYWYQNNAGAVTGFPTAGVVVDNSGTISSGGSFDVDSVGITIFAQ